MKNLLWLYFSLLVLLAVSGCNKEKEEELIPETQLQLHQKHIKGTWKKKEGYTQSIDKNGTVTRSVRTTPFIGDQAVYSFDGKERIVTYDPGYNRPPAKNSYTITEKDNKFYLDLGKLLYVQDPDASYIIEISVTESTILEDTKFTYPDGSIDNLQNIYIRVP